MIFLVKQILPGKTIGIIGGGQLGRMMALAAKAMGYRIFILDPGADCPASQVADGHIIADYDDLDALGKLQENSDVITYEFENISAEALEWIAGHAYVPQGTELLSKTQDRISEKTAIQAAGQRVAPYKVIKGKEDLNWAISTIGYPAVLKTSRGGYDGKGQHVIKTPEDLEGADALIEQGLCVLEKWLPFEKEISVIVTRSVTGETKVLPVAENIHHENILHETIVPARISKGAEQNAIEAAETLASEFALVGTLAVEMFLAADDGIYINELAPRPHNSGHYSIEACETSQFEQHIRAVCGLPLGTTRLLSPAVMVNILGQHQAPIVDKLPKLQDWKIHFYGKAEAKHQRKMGHATLLRNSAEEALAEIEATGIWEKTAEKIGGIK
ncbi:5-(carboxyamino)imidazole ribonucleotide synthase [Bacillus massilinigeriensis]|uniref:5-(carboxyamino)imidazole ribonucleotide synthase n=1 Tax=Bacillus mediterraneensis TaxID=1805474 RepID=UPI0008F85A8E|nr:5-(carboxyamino)imidazole ribonucleotide synthase [Bacillus mediterraneensis]